MILKDQLEEYHSHSGKKDPGPNHNHGSQKSGRDLSGI